MAEKVTRMAIRVDLGCYKCRKKIKKVLCKIPQIQNQIYDEKSNTVTITVVCCCPEKVKDKICCKAGNIILGIEIIVPPKPEPEPKPKPKPAQPPPEPEPKPKPKPAQPPPKPEPKPKPEPTAPKPQEPAPLPPPAAPEKNGKPPSLQPGQQPSDQSEPPSIKKKPPEPAPAFPPLAFRQPAPCYRDCHEGYGWGPCYRDPCMPPPCYGRPVYDSWGGGGGGGCRRIYVSRCSDYESEENPNAACIIM